MRLKLLTVTNEMKVELTELNKYEGKLKQPNGPKANEGATNEDRGTSETKQYRQEESIDEGRECKIEREARRHEFTAIK